MDGRRDVGADRDMTGPWCSWALLAACCGSSRWVDAMLARRPFENMDALLTSARERWATLSPAEWKDAFRHHPRIGDHGAIETTVAASRPLSAKEQAGIDRASQ